MNTFPCSGCQCERPEADFFPSTLRSKRKVFRCKECFRQSARRTYGWNARTPRDFSGNAPLECVACQTVKDGSEFFPSALRRRQAWCKACCVKDQAERRKRTPNFYSQRFPHLFKARVWFNELKERSACTECGENHPAVLEWHHLDRSQKSFEIGTGVAKGKPIEALEAETAKCVVLCSNCHRKHHYNERAEKGNRFSLVA